MQDNLLCFAVLPDAICGAGAKKTATLPSASFAIQTLWGQMERMAANLKLPKT